MMADKSIQSKLSLLSRELECPLCLDHFKTPKTLPCNHSFCLGCLQDHIRQNSLDENKTSFNCPCCRTISHVPEQGVEAFVANHIINSLFTLVEDLESGSFSDLDGFSEVNCSACPDEAPKAVARYRCLPCGDDLCKECYSAHRRTKLTRDHKVLPLDEIRAGKHDADIRQAKIVKCDIHPDEDVKYFCEICYILICRDCIAVEHRGHECNHIPNARKRYQPKLQNTLEKYLKDENTVDKIRQHAEIQITAIAEKQQRVQAELNKAFVRETERLHKEKEALIDKLLKECSSHTKKLEMVRDRANMHVQSSKRQREHVQALLSDGSDIELLNEYKDVITVVHQNEEELMEKIPRLPNLVTISYMPRENKSDLQLGTIKVIEPEQKELTETFVKEIIKDTPLQNGQDAESTLDKGFQNSYQPIILKKQNSSPGGEVGNSSPSADRTIIVEGIKADTSSDELQNFFANKKSGGGSVEILLLHTDIGMALVKFVKTGDAQCIAKREKVVLKASILTVTLWSGLHGDQEPIFKTCALEVQGFTSSTPKDIIRMAFNKCFESNDGHVEDVFITDKKSLAVVTFSSPEAAKQVLMGSPLKLKKGTCLNVSALKPPAPHTEKAGQKEKDKLILKGLTEETTGQQIENFINRHADGSVKRVMFPKIGGDTGMAMVCFRGNTDNRNLREICATKPLNGRVMSVHKVKKGEGQNFQRGKQMTMKELGDGHCR